MKEKAWERKIIKVKGLRVEAIRNLLEVSFVTGVNVLIILFVSKHEKPKRLSSEL